MPRRLCSINSTSSTLNNIQPSTSQPLRWIPPVLVTRSVAATHNDVNTDHISRNFLLRSSDMWGQPTLHLGQLQVAATLAYLQRPNHTIASHRTKDGILNIFCVLRTYLTGFTLVLILLLSLFTNIFTKFQNANKTFRGTRAFHLDEILPKYCCSMLLYPQDCLEKYMQ